MIMLSTKKAGVTVTEMSIKIYLARAFSFFRFSLSTRHTKEKVQFFFNPKAK